MYNNSTQAPLPPPPPPPQHATADPSASVYNNQTNTSASVGEGEGVNKADSLLSTSSALASPNLHAHTTTNDDHDDHHINNNSNTLSSAALEIRLNQLRSTSSTLSTTLTQKLATSQSGQNLLHIGSSLSTLPPDLYTLLSALAPFSADVTSFEEANRNELARVVAKGNEIKSMRRRCVRGRECADMLEDLCCAEVDVERDGKRRVRLELVLSGGGDGKNGGGSEAEGDDELDELNHVASLERAAHTTLHLVQELRASTAEMSAFTSAQSPNNTNSSPSSSDINNKNSNNNSALLPSLHTPLPDDTEKAQFLLKLAPRIRSLEKEVVKCLEGRLEIVLRQMKRRKMEAEGHHGDEDEESKEMKKAMEEESLLMIGHCLRGLALLGRGKEAESTFARVAIMPLIRSKISMGRLDEGGSRGECAGLFSLLDDIAYSIASTFGSVLRLSEGIFATPSPLSSEEEGGKDEPMPPPPPMEVDLVTCGVWVPIATALMADPGIRMAIFSPGIASILQANYTALDTFLSELSVSLLKMVSKDDDSKAGDNGNNSSSFSEGDFESLYFQPVITNQTIQYAQGRIYHHEKTTEFAKKWNLPIYYQLRFGECCTRLNKALANVQRNGWDADVFTGLDTAAKDMRHKQGFELTLFLELYSILLSLWKSDVILRPLAHRFLRGAVQLLGRTVAFVKDGLEGTIKFGETNSTSSTENGSLGVNGDVGAPSFQSEYCWGDRVEDVASVAWELTVLETCLTHDYLQTIVSVVAPPDVTNRSNVINTEAELVELRGILSDVMEEASQEISPIIHKCWDEIIAGILTQRCSAPLSAVKGVAATYRMTNRPPPTQHSPFVSTILRPLKDFDAMFANRTPPQVGMQWKVSIVSAVSERYSVAVEELLATVQRTEVTLKNRKARRTAAGGMSDGEKVKLQLYLDHIEFAKNVEEVGVDGSSIPGVMKLEALTKEAENLHLKTVGGSN